MQSPSLHSPASGVGPNTEVFFAKMEAVGETYRQAFAGPPWNEDLPAEEVNRRLTRHSQLPGFEAIVVEAADGSVAGGAWYDRPGLPDIIRDRGYELGDFVMETVRRESVETLVFEREIMVHPDFQGQGMATDIRRSYLDHLEREYEKGALLLTRMRSDNVGILAVARKFNFHPTGVQTSSASNPEAVHEFWYKVVRAGRLDFEIPRI